MEETNSTNQDQPVDKFELKLQRSADGQKANSRGKLVAALVGRASGAVRAEGYDNNIWAIDGERVPVPVMEPDRMSPNWPICN